jgi:hypothetical protein
MLAPESGPAFYLQVQREPTLMRLNNRISSEKEDLTLARRQSQQQYFWKHIWSGLGIAFGSVLVGVSPLLLGLYLKLALGRFISLAVIAALLYFGIKTRILTAGALTTRLIYVICLAGEVVFALLLFLYLK